MAKNIRVTAVWVVMAAAEADRPGDPGNFSKAAVVGSDSNVAALSLAIFRATLGQKYRQFDRALGLSPKQIGAFENLLTARQEEIIDLNAVALADGPDARPDVEAIRRQEDDDFRVAQLALLGERGYRQFQEFNRAVPVWGVVIQMVTWKRLPRPVGLFSG